MRPRSCCLALLSVCYFLLPVIDAAACPFCNAVSQTLRQEMEMMDAVVIAKSVSGEVRDPESGEINLEVTQVLRGSEFVRPKQIVRTVYYGNVNAGRKFMLNGVDPPDMQWSCIPLSDRSEAYLIRVHELTGDDVERLKFFYGHLEDEDPMLARDTYDEFAIAPYAALLELKDHMDQDQLIRWLKTPEMPANRKRMYYTMLGVCGDEKDLPMLEASLRSTQKNARSGLDALIACYLTLAGEKGLPLIDELFLANDKAIYADTYAAIMAIRFHGTESQVIPRSALLPSLHLVLKRAELADLVIPDLARWGDWSQVNRMVTLFSEAKQDNNWVRVPVVNYLRACPLPEAKASLEKLKQIDPKSVSRANTFFSVPVPASAPSPKSSSMRSEMPRVDGSVSPVKQPIRTGPVAEKGNPFSGEARFEAPQVAASLPVASKMNLGGMLSVFAMATASLMITAWLILSGGASPLQEESTNELGASSPLR